MAELKLAVILNCCGKQQAAAEMNTLWFMIIFLPLFFIFSHNTCSILSPIRQIPSRQIQDVELVFSKSKDLMSY